MIFICFIDVLICLHCIKPIFCNRMEGKEIQYVQISSRLQRLEIELIDIEESLKFSQRGLLSLREVIPLFIQNCSKCLKVFYELDEFIVKSLDEKIYTLLRKIMDCISAGFCKAMDIIARSE
jgi:hypothetical protein